jgi:hypothetical protein
MDHALSFKSVVILAFEDKRIGLELLPLSNKVFNQFFVEMKSIFEKFAQLVGAEPQCIPGLLTNGKHWRLADLKFANGEETLTISELYDAEKEPRMVAMLIIHAFRLSFELIQVISESSTFKAAREKRERRAAHKDPEQERNREREDITVGSERPGAESEDAKRAGANLPTASSRRKRCGDSAFNALRSQARLHVAEVGSTAESILHYKRFNPQATQCVLEMDDNDDDDDEPLRGSQIGSDIMILPVTYLDGEEGRRYLIEHWNLKDLPPFALNEG